MSLLVLTSMALEKNSACKYNAFVREISSVVEHHPHTVAVEGSIPLSPTMVYNTGAVGFTKSSSLAGIFCISGLNGAIFSPVGY